MNLIYFLDDINCGGEGILKIIRFVWILLGYVKFIVPIGLIIMVMVDFAKNVIAGREDDMKKNVSIIFKRILFAMAIFFIPAIVQTAIHLLGESGVNYAVCIDVAMDSTINLSDYKTKYESDDFGNNDIVIPDSLKKKDNGKKKPSNSGDGSSNKVDAALKENIAAVIVMEQGCNSEKVYLKYITTAVYINNYALRNDGNVEITREGLHKANLSYASSYNDLTFDAAEIHRGRQSEDDRKRCLKIVDDVLDKKFTIPKNVVFAAAPYIITQYGTIWGQENLTGGTWPVAVGYPGTTIESVDVYGNKVSTDWAETVKKAKKLYE